MPTPGTHYPSRGLEKPHVSHALCFLFYTWQGRKKASQPFPDAHFGEKGLSQWQRKRMPNDLAAGPLGRAPYKICHIVVMSRRQRAAFRAAIAVRWSSLSPRGSLTTRRRTFGCALNFKLHGGRTGTTESRNRRQRRRHHFNARNPARPEEEAATASIRGRRSSAAAGIWLG